MKAGLCYWMDQDLTSRGVEEGHRRLPCQYDNVKAQLEFGPNTKVHISACSVQSSITRVQELRDFTVYLKPFFNKSLCSVLPPGSTASFPFSANKVLIWMDGWIERKGGWARDWNGDKNTDRNREHELIHFPFSFTPLTFILFIAMFLLCPCQKKRNACKISVILVIQNAVKDGHGITPSLSYSTA